MKQAIVESQITPRIAELLIANNDANNTFARNVSWTLSNFLKIKTITIDQSREAVLSVIKVMRSTAFHDTLLDCMWGLANFIQDG
jgi:hypothetical protein